MQVSQHYVCKNNKNLKKKEAIEQFTKKKTYFFIVVRDCLAKECLELA